MRPLYQVLLGGASFGEDEEHFRFRFRLLFVIILFGIFTSGSFILGHYLAGHSMGEVHLYVMEAHIAACVALAFLLHGRKDRFRAVALAYGAVSLAVMASCFLHVPQDELRALWFFLALPGFHLILGPPAGILYAAAATGLIITLNPLGRAPYSVHALATTVVGFAYLATVFHAFSSRSISYFERLVESRQRLRHLAHHDALTGLMNLRAYQEACGQALALARRTGAPLSLLFLDLDHFKRINDTHGHGAGDAVLQAVAGCLQGEIRTSDVAGRVGGEEFAVLLPGTDGTGALALGEKLRRSVEALEIPAGGGVLRVTASIGVASRQERHGSFADIQQEADAAMYLAKQGGRNRVSRLDPEGAAPVPAAPLDPEAFTRENCAGCAIAREGRPCPLAAVVRTYAKARADAGEILLRLAPDREGRRVCAMGRDAA